MTKFKTSPQTDVIDTDDAPESSSEETVTESSGPDTVDTANAPATPAPKAQRPDTVARVLGVLIPVAALIAGFWVVRDVNPSHAGLLGLVQLLPISYFAILSALTISFVLQLQRDNRSSTLLALHVVAYVTVLHGSVSFIEGTARFAASWTHVGLTEYISRTSHTLPNLDARMSWPGFFALAALLNDIAGVKSAETFLLWTPLAINLLCIPLVFSVVRATTNDRRIPWLATWLFFTTSWVGQDYFSPQAVNFILFLTIMAIILRVFRTDKPLFNQMSFRLNSAVSRLTKTVLRVPRLAPGGSPTIELTPARRALLVSILLTLYAASVVSHQLTPVFILLAVAFLVVLQRMQLTGLPLLLVVGMFTWISYGAVGFWSGHIRDLFGGLGQVGGTVDSNVGSKVQGHTDHNYVIYGRLLMATGVWGLALFGGVRRLRKGITDVPVLVCFIAPFFILGGQSYGGEAILRVFLFSLPFAAALISFALLPTEAVKFTWFKTAIASVVLVALIPAFALTRYGNEQFEYINKDEVVAVKYLYTAAPTGSTVVALNGNGPLRQERSEQYTFRTNLLRDDLQNPDAVAAFMNQKPDRYSFLIITHSMIEATAVKFNLPSNWADTAQQRLAASDKLTVIYSNPSATIYKLKDLPS